LELLLRDKSNPRALAYQLDRLGDDLRALPPAESGARVREELLERLLSVIALLREADLVALARPAADGRRVPLAELLDRLSGSLADLASAMERAYFRPAATLRPLPAASGRWMR
jgi:uncharacterized alpha-E superfamily protein